MRQMPLTNWRLRRGISDGHQTAPAGVSDDERVVPRSRKMRKSITVLMIMLIAVGLLTSFADPVAADHDTKAEAENEAEIDNNIEQDQNIEQNNEQNGAAVAFDGDAKVKQDNEQNADQEQTAVNYNQAVQDAVAAALSFNF